MLPCRKASEPSSSTTSTVTGMPLPSSASSKSSGRTPTVMSGVVMLSAAARGTAIAHAPKCTLPSETGNEMRFIAGEPMKPATNMFAGVSYISRGFATCWRMPSLRTATRSPMVMASTWSCVT
jgi:hypothetical protein